MQFSGNFVLFVNQWSLHMNKLAIHLSFLLLAPSLWSQQEVMPLGAFPDAVSETSGLIFYKGSVITHNDSGNTPLLFEIDTISLELTRTVTVDNVQNVDWEDMAQDDHFIYIGDFGNNLGTRTDLAIYRIAKSDYDSSDAVSAEQIYFSYEDQTDFTDNGNSDWDAEALFVLNDQLVILTKQWQANGTVAYAVPKTPGTYRARRLDSFNSQGLVTGATYHPETNLLYFVGYTTLLDAFIYRVEGCTEAHIFGGNVERLTADIGFSQVEAIGYVDTDSYLISSELFSSENPLIILPSTLYTLTTVDTISPNPEPEPAPEPQPEPGIIVENLLVYKPLGSDVLIYELPTEQPPLIARAIFDFSGRLLWYETGSDLENNSIDLSGLPNAIYSLALYFRDSKLTTSFAVY